MISLIVKGLWDLNRFYTDNLFTSQLELPKLINKPVLILLAFKYDNN
jgi:hypothetical protein